MKASDLLRQLRAAGVVPTIASDDSLVWSGPAEVLTAEILDVLTRYAGAIRAALAREVDPPPTGPCWACRTRTWWTANGRAWICGVCHRPAPGVPLLVAPSAEFLPILTPSHCASLAHAPEAGGPTRADAPATRHVTCAPAGGRAA